MAVVARHRRLAACLVLSLAVIAAAPHLLSQPPALGEYQVKAAFLFNFLKFVEWPAEALARSGDSFVIGILGKDPFGTALEDTVRGEMLHDRKLVVRRFSTLEEAAQGQLVFVSASEEKRLMSRLQELGRAGVLTVGDSADYANPGAVINFWLEGNKVRFEVNLEAAKRADLKISSQLLKLARAAPSSPRKGT
jgi:hypothetical protein